MNFILHHYFEKPNIKFNFYDKNENLFNKNNKNLVFKMYYKIKNNKFYAKNNKNNYILLIKKNYFYNNIFLIDNNLDINDKISIFIIDFLDCNFINKFINKSYKNFKNNKKLKNEKIKEINQIIQEKNKKYNYKSILQFNIIIAIILFGFFSIIILYLFYF